MKNNSHKRKRVKGNLRIILEFIPFFILYKMIQWMSLKSAYRLSRWIFYLLFIIDRKHRNRAIKHILHANVATEPALAKSIALKSFFSFSQLLVEIIKMNQLYSSDKIKRSGNPETVQQVFGTKGENINVIIVTAHYGNWEVAGTGYADISGIPMVSIMRPFANYLVGKYILRNRESGSHTSVSKTHGVKELFKALKSGKTIAILADQHASSGEGIETTFFGQPCRTHATPALLHLKTGVPIMPEVTRRLDNNFGFEFYSGELIRYTPTGDKQHDVKVITQMFTTALEKMIAEKPEQWMWVHRRWLNIHRDRKKNHNQSN
jgi:KDO2-lipid IV(A) lauroyltransferase